MKRKAARQIVFKGFRIIFIVASLLGILGGRPTTPAQAAPAGAGNALAFDGTDDYVSTDTAPSLNMAGSSFTIELWIWGDDSLNYDSERLLVEYGTWETGTYQLTTMHDDHFNVNFHGQSSEQGSEAIVDWSDSQWHHLAGVFDNDADTLKTYFDGVLQNTTTENNAPGDTDLALYLASRGGTEMFSQVKMDEVRIWNTARMADQLRANMYRKLTGSETGLVAYYKMDDGSGVTLTDSAGSADGTLTNGPGWITSGAFSGPRNALDFDGTDDYVAADSVTDALNSPTAFSYAAWVYPEGQSSEDGVIMAFNTSTGGNRNMVEFSTGGQFYYRETIPP